MEKKITTGEEIQLYIVDAETHLQEYQNADVSF